jgi:hypothetical protein
MNTFTPSMKTRRDGVFRDTVALFNCQRRDYLGCCAFSNSIEKFGVKSSSIQVLENGHRGFRLKMQAESGREYEVLLDGGGVKLGLVRSHQPRLLLAEGSANSESTWSRFAEVIREREARCN